MGMNQEMPIQVWGLSQTGLRTKLVWKPQDAEGCPWGPRSSKATGNLWLSSKFGEDWILGVQVMDPKKVPQESTF